MAERPILFSAPMVRAILAGHKTQTRRLATNRNCARIEVGDTLWVRETWRPAQVKGMAWYRADWNGEDPHPPGRWRPSIYMPRWASRITLRVTGLRCEPLQSITVSDVHAEGVTMEVFRQGTVAANVAERNQSGVRLVRDLVPSNVVDDQVGLDTLCAALLAAGDEDY